MNQSMPRILLLNEYSNCHRALATGLRRLGCDVVVASNGGWMDCERDIDISRRPGKLGGLLYTLKMNDMLRHELGGFDIVSLNDPNFVQLSPRYMRMLFDVIRRHNRGVFLTDMSTDLAFLDMVEAADSPLRYNEWFVDGKRSRMFEADPSEWDRWHNRALVDYQNYVFDRLDGAVSVLYEYQLSMERRLGSDRAAYGGIPIDTQELSVVELPDRIEKVRLFLGRDNRRLLMKGTDMLEYAARRVVEKYPDRAELVIVENRPLAEFTELLRSAHVVLDQIYSYTPATTALMAMSYGLNVVTGAEPEFYDFIGEHHNQPIINAPIEQEALTRTIEQIVLHRELIRERGLRGREFVVKHNDCEVVAKRFLNFWQSRLKQKC